MPARFGRTCRTRIAAVGSPEHYPKLVVELRRHHGVSAELRAKLAAESFGLVAAYYAEIAAYLNQISNNTFPNRLAVVLEKVDDLRYGENPHQRAAFYRETTHRSGTLADATQGGIPWRDVAPYVVAQIVGAFAGVAVAHVMFGEPTFFASQHVRTGLAQWVSEFVATFGLLATIWGCVRRRPGLVPFAVGAYITAAYWFTSSTSFANPAVTIARAASDTFAGIRPVDVPGFVVAQLLGAAAATVTFRWLVPALPTVADRVTGRPSPTEEKDAA